MKKKVLIATSPMVTGGVTSSLLSLLSSIDYKKYEIDLIMARNEGEYFSAIPEDVNILPPALNEKNKHLAKIQKLMLYLLKGYIFRGLFYKLYKHKIYKNGYFQIMSGHARSSVARRLRSKYDIAVGYMEGFANAYISKKVNADKKVGYIHVDFEMAGLDPDIDRKLLNGFDKIVLVSKDCKKSFDRLFPEYSHKSIVVENIVSPVLVRKRAQEEIDFFLDEAYFNIVTVARLQNSHKALYRAVDALKRLKDDGYKARWYVFGEGPDRGVLERQIQDLGLENEFFLMGNRKNVYPYIKKFDVFVLTSKYEGKPIAVTEAQILDVPVISTRYSAADEQINDEFDGLIVDDDDYLIYNKIKYVLDNKIILDKFRDNLSKRRFFGDESEIDLEKMWF